MRLYYQELTRDLNSLVGALRDIKAKTAFRELLKKETPIISIVTLPDGDAFITLTEDYKKLIDRY